MDIKDLIDALNNGDFNQYLPYIGSYQNFFNFVKRKGLISEIDPASKDSEEWQNQFILWAYENDKPLYYKTLSDILYDVEIIDGKPYLKIDNLGDIAKLFCDGRNDIPQDTVESILSGEYDSNYGYDRTDDVYRDVIEELNPKNQKILFTYIIDNLNGIKIEPTTDELEFIAEEQGHDDYVVVNESNVERIVNDKKTMKHLLDDELGDLESELSSIYGNAYQSAYESEIYNSIWSEINNYFEGRGETLSRPHKFHANTTVYTYRLPIINFEGIINDFLSSEHSYSLDYDPVYLSILRESIDCISVSPPDYPDSREVDKNVNEFFSDYI
jgi:hypothetical protein